MKILWLNSVPNTYLLVEIMVPLPAPLGSSPPPATAMMVVLLLQPDYSEALVKHILAWKPYPGNSQKINTATC